MVERGSFLEESGPYDDREDVERGHLSGQYDDQEVVDPTRFLGES